MTNQQLLDTATSVFADLHCDILVTESAKDPGHFTVTARCKHFLYEESIPYGPGAPFRAELAGMRARMIEQVFRGLHGARLAPEVVAPAVVLPPAPSVPPMTPVATDPVSKSEAKRVAALKGKA